MPTIEQFEFTAAAIVVCIKERLAKACQESFGSSLRAVAITGSVARDEMSYTCTAGQAFLLSDVEAIIVLHDTESLPSHQRNSGLCKRIEQMLAEMGIHAHVSLSIVHSAYLRKLPAHIYSYELLACGVVVAGETTILEQIPNFTASELDVEDAWRLLSNRLIEQMVIETKVLDPRQIQYCSMKLCLDLATSLLVFIGGFQAGYRARLRQVEGAAELFESVRLPFSFDEFLPLLRHCTDAKLHSESAIGLSDGDAEKITELAWLSWNWQLQRMTGLESDASLTQAIRALGREQGITNRLRGWFYVVRRAGWISSARLWPKWAALFAQGLTPRYAIYLAAYLWQCKNDHTPERLKMILGLLPVADELQADSSSEIARQIYNNYQEFVTETRA